LFGEYVNRTYEFKSDVENFVLKKNGKPIEPIIQNYRNTTLDFNLSDYYGTYSGEDLAQYGYFIYPIDAFLPDSNSFSEFSFDIVNHIDNQTVTFLIPENIINKINVDFEPYTGDRTGLLAYKEPVGVFKGYRMLCGALMVFGLLIAAAGA
jgi:hypothetical protein